MGYSRTVKQHRVRGGQLRRCEKDAARVSQVAMRLNDSGGDAEVVAGCLIAAASLTQHSHNRPIVEFDCDDTVLATS